MVLGIKQYPVDVDADELIEFIDASIAEGSLLKRWIMYPNLLSMMVRMIS